MQPERSSQPAGLVPRIRHLVGSRIGGREEGAADAGDDRHAVIDRLRDALDAHDLDAMVALLHPDYQAEEPLHPTPGPIDRAQVRRNWETILADVPDIRTELLDRASSRDAVWTEWRFWGTRRDGGLLDLRAVWIVGIERGLMRWGRLYREPIQAGEESSADESVERLTRPE